MTSSRLDKPPTHAANYDKPQAGGGLMPPIQSIDDPVLPQINEEMDRSLKSKTQIDFERRMVEAAIDSAVNAIIIIDDHGIVQRINPATEKMFGFAEADLVGENVRMLMPVFHRDAHDTYLQNYLTTGERKIIGIGREVEGRRKDGRIFPMHLSVGEFEADGKRYFVGTIHDISARAAAEAEGAHQRALFEAIFNNCPDAMVLSDEAHCITLCNPAAARIFGYATKALTGEPARKLFASDADYDRFASIVSCEMPSGDPGASLIGFARRSGEHFPGIAATADIIGRGGAHLGFLAVIRDVSREVAQEQALRQIQRMEALGQLTGGIAHDFNNLLTIITGNLELLDLEIEDDYQRDLLKRATDSAHMGARLTDRLLTFARRRSLNAVLLNLNEQLLGMMDLLRRTLGETISITASLAPDLLPVRSDVSEIENAVLNLAINARDAMAAGGRLMVETRNVLINDVDFSRDLGLPPGSYVRISVSDTGHGIEPDVLLRVFEPFFTTKAAGRGTGLGLSVIYGFAKQSGGLATIYSEVRRGTTVNIYLPGAEAGGGAGAEDKSAVNSRVPTGEIVLVVEDQAPVREVTMRRLQRLGYAVKEAEDAVTAIKLLEAGEAADVIFSDVVMPGGLSGFDLAAWVRVNRPGLPVVLTSGFAEDAAQALAQDEVATTILRKPYSGDELAWAIRKALDTSG